MAKNPQVRIELTDEELVAFRKHCLDLRTSPAQRLGELVRKETEGLLSDVALALLDARKHLRAGRVGSAKRILDERLETLEMLVQGQRDSL